MQLKSLEIHGFKSFADKTKIYFDQGITGIVGPNGCGKSNIVDSIRWVLGEQRTRNLRSEKMSNIIFNGTTRRKKANFCQVTLTFENTKNVLPTEFSTIAISRKLYANGDSEYMINGVPCRLKDIQNMFLDTGVGPDSYAIIELKMVEEILNDKEGSRRQLFEEAAGISKYKIRKKETLKKLSDTQSDLDRVEDVLYEIDNQLKSLERQAKKTKRYFELKEKYRAESSRYAWFTIRGLRDEYDKIEGHEKSYADKLTEVQTLIAHADARIQELRKEQLDNENILSESQKDLNRHNEKIREIEKEKSIKNERLKYLQQREYAIGDQIETEKKQLARLREELAMLETRHEEVEKQFKVNEKDLAQKKLAAEEKKALHEERKMQTENLATDHRELEQEVNRLAKDQEIKQIQIQSLNNEFKRYQEDRDTKTEELDSFTGTLSTLQTEKEALEIQVADLRQKKEQNEQELDAAINLVTELKDSIYKINRGLDARKNEYDLTKSLVENLEGFPESVKFLKKEADWMRNSPLLSDVFNTEEAFKVAFENLLEAFLSYYVVPTREDAIQAVQLLARSNKGRANFFVLEEIEGYKPHPIHTFEKAVSALELVEFAPEYAGLAHYLLDQVYVVDHEADIPAEIPEHTYFITKSGNLLRRKFLLGGGSIGLFQGKRLGRAKNLKKLEEEIRKLEKDLNKQKTELDREEKRVGDLKAVNFSKELDELSRELQKKSQDWSVLQAREKEYRDFIARAGERTEVIEKQIEDLETELVGIGPRLAELRKAHEEQTGILREARMMLENSAEEVSELSQAFNAANIAFIQTKNHLENLQRDRAQKSERIAQLEENETKLRTELDQTKKDIHSLVDNNLQNDSEIVGLYEEKKAKETRTEQLEQKAVNFRNMLSQQEQTVRQHRNRKEELETERTDLKDKVTEVKIKLNALKERMQVEFNVDISDLDEAELFEGGVEAWDASDVEDKMLKLRQQLQSYGEINPMAVEAYDEMKERYDFISAQKKDLIESRQTLLDTINEIDQTATQKFMEAFTNVRDNFRKVFQHLFSEGDTCDLSLADVNDPLESSIDIMAKPKGKRPLTINQLSGGEKTLTAVALLFSIYLLKPAPFCIFDEVDAPLDDANIDKFNNIIRDFSKDSQFIIVTHNKRTMASTNVMYGVTMEAHEQGVSKVLPVDLVALNLN